MHKTKSRSSKNKARRHKRRVWLLRESARKLRHRIRRQNKATKKLERILNDLAINRTNYRSVGYNFAEKRMELVLPSALDFEENYEETASHFRILRKAVENGIRIKKIHFSQIRKISTSAALVLASTVDQWNDRVKGKIKADVPSWDNELKRLLCQMGYFELLNLKMPEKDWDDGSINFLPFLKGRVGESVPGEKARQLRIEIEKIVGQEINRHFLYEGISEAITNVCQHAYETKADELRKFWWLTASYDSETRELCVTFYDKGLGIPKTLPSHAFYAKLLNFFQGWSDSKKIQAAMELGRTSSGLEERGKGLQNLIEFAKFHSMGRLRVSSLRGTYEECYESNPEGIPTRNCSLHDHKCSIGGTLIEWSVILS